MTRLSAICAAMMLATIGSASAKGPFGSIHIGNWNGGAYTNDNTGAFSHCAAGAQYLNGTFLVLSQLKDNSWSLGLANEAYQLTSGETFPIDLTRLLRKLQFEARFAGSLVGNFW